MRASRPQEMKSSTSQRAGSSRTFLKTMYFTSGAYVMTSRLRTCWSPVALYSRHSSRAASAEILRFAGVVVVFIVVEAPGGKKVGGALPWFEGGIGSGVWALYHRLGVIAARSSPYAHTSTSATAIHSSSGTSCPSA